MFTKEEDKFGKIYTWNRPEEGTVEHLTDLDLGDLFIFAGGREILRLGEDGDDAAGSFLTATRILTDEVIWTSYDYEWDCSGIRSCWVDWGFSIKEESPRIMRIKETAGKNSGAKSADPQA